MFFQFFSKIAMRENRRYMDLGYNVSLWSFSSWCVQSKEICKIKHVVLLLHKDSFLQEEWVLAWTLKLTSLAVTIWLYSCVNQMTRTMDSSGV